LLEEISKRVQLLTYLKKALRKCSCLHFFHSTI